MKDHNFEHQLGRQDIRPLPAQWRREILRSTCATSETGPGWLRQLLWPHPAAWAALAAVWMVIVGIHLSEPNQDVRPEGATAAAQQEESLALAEQRRLWLELIGPAPRASASKEPSPSEEVETGPRSERFPPFGGARLRRAPLAMRTPAREDTRSTKVEPALNTYPAASQAPSQRPSLGTFNTAIVQA